MSEVYLLAGSACASTTVVSWFVLFWKLRS